MAHDPDLLDHLGYVPRELGSVQLHIEPVLVVEAERRAFATALLQPAFEGALSGKLLPTALTAMGDRAVAADLSIPMPRLNRSVVRWRFSFPLLAIPEEILFRLEAPIPKDAERIRAAWKLLETVEQPIEVRNVSAGVLGGDDGDALGMGLRMAVGLAMGHVVIPMGVLDSIGRTPLQVDGPQDLTRHKAPESLQGFVAKVVPVPSIAGFRDEVEVLWKPGMELPDPPPSAPISAPVASLQPASKRRPCRDCGNDVDVAEAEHDRQCPACGAPWLY